MESAEYPGTAPPCVTLLLKGISPLCLLTPSLYCSQLRECELSPVVNRELSWRIRHVSGITQHRPILRNDIKLAARLIHALDERGQLWKEAQDGEVRAPEVSGEGRLIYN